jgi:hypothetical protein
MKIKAITRTSESGALPAHFPGWLEERFSGHYAQIGTLNTLKLKNAVRDVARALLGRVPPDIEYLAKGFIVPPQGVNDKKFVLGYNTDEGYVSGSIETDKNLQEYISKYPDHWDLVLNSLSLWKSKGRHAAGYVISNEPIDEFIPTTTTSGIKTLEFSGPDAEAVGAIKMDFLTVNCLKDVQEATRLIQTRICGKTPDDTTINGLKVPGVRIVPGVDGRLWDLWDLPQDKDVFDDIYLGKVETVFQLDSNSARRWLPYFKGIFNSEEDLSLFTALDRPGPLEYFVTNPDCPSTKHNMLVEYARRAQGKKGSQDIVKELDTLCAETKGVMVYQESLMKVYRYFTDCTAIEAEEFRRMIGKKKKEKVEKAYSHFMEKASEKVGKEAAQDVWDSITTWSSYGFCHAHSRSYGKLAYTCLWLKHYYPLEWWTSVCRNATKDEMNDKFWMHCSHLVLLPDISLSKGDWEIEGDKIRAPVSILKGVGETAHKQLSQSAPYRDLRHFCQSIVDYVKANPITKDKTDKEGNVKKVTVWGRNALNIGKIHSMLAAGCMDSFFEKDLTLSQKADLYHSMMKEVYAANGGKYKQPKKKMPSLDALGRYQSKKDVLPLYGEDLRPILVATGLPDFLQTDGRCIRIKNKVWSKDAECEVDTFDPVIGAKQLIELENSEGFVDRFIKCGIVCYLEEKEKFNYNKNGSSKEAYKFFIEFGGMKKELVLWPDFNNEIPTIAKEVEAGSIIVMIMQKNTGRTDFSIRGIEVVRKPLSNEEKLDTKAEEE